MYHCDVIRENLLYGGTHILGHDQTAHYARVMRGVRSGLTIFVAHEHLQHRVTRRLTRLQTMKSHEKLMFRYGSGCFSIYFNSVY